MPAEEPENLPFSLIISWKTYSDPPELYLDFDGFLAQGKTSQGFFGNKVVLHSAAQIMYQASQSYRSCLQENQISSSCLLIF